MSTDLPSLRPHNWDGYIGQERLKHALQVQITAAIAGNRTMGHLLFTAFPGAGKTTLAELVAEHLGDDFVRLNMPVSRQVLARAIRDFRGVLLLDELHALSKAEQEALLPLIEDGYLQMPSGEKIWADCTIIGATTEGDKIIKPLWDRFEASGGVMDWDPYSDEDCARIIAGMARIRRVELSEEAATTYGVAAAGEPRLSAKFVNAHSNLSVTLGRPPTPSETLEYLRVTPNGLTRNHQRYLEILDAVEGRAGLGVIANLLRLSEGVVVDLERLLVGRGYVRLTSSGRELTQEGMDVVRPRTRQRDRRRAA